MNGVAEINTQYAGIEVDYKVVLTVTGTNTVNWKVIIYRILKPIKMRVMSSKHLRFQAAIY